MKTKFPKPKLFTLALGVMLYIGKIFALAVAITIFGGFWDTVVASGGGKVLADPGAMEGKHFDPKGKMPSKFTIELQKGLRATLPFDDKRDFEEAKRGFVAAPAYKQIMSEAGNVAWDMAATSTCCRARTSTASIRRCSARPS
jgi:hypothetical protein